MERARQDLAAYRETPPAEDELALAAVPIDYSDLTDDTDWAALYPEKS